MIKLPRGYLSYSQLVLWEKNKNAYYQIYYEGVPTSSNKYMVYGKQVAEYLENGKMEKYNKDFEFLSIILPTYPKREYPIKVMYEGIKLYGKFDGFNPRKLEVGEYKTGKKYTQAMVDKNDQLTFYAFMVWLKYKKIPALKLCWIETRELNDDEVCITGKHKIFEAKRTVKDFLLLGKRIRKAAKEISELEKFNKIGR